MALDNPMVRLQDAINSHDPERVASCFSRNYRSEIPMHPSRSFQGNSYVVENWSRIYAQTRDLKAEVLRFSSQEGLTWSEWEIQGTSVERGPTLIRGVVICTFQDDLINWTRFYLDPVVDDRLES